jgi:SAM-dependent methyltransferase
VRRKYNRNALVYDSMDRMIRDEWRRKVVREARGRVLEIGVGTGKNLPLYDPQITQELVGIDFSPGMLGRARRKQCGVPHSLLEMDAQALSFPDASFDTVIATCVFILLLEHVRIDRPLIGPLMDLLDPVSVLIVGTHINRRTVENVRLAGMHVDQLDAISGDLVKLIHASP